MRLELADNRENLIFDREYNLNTGPLQIDLMGPDIQLRVEEGVREGLQKSLQEDPQKGRQKGIQEGIRKHGGAASGIWP